jgi:hypothetical protein
MYTLKFIYLHSSNIKIESLNLEKKYSYYNANLLPSVVAMHVCIIFGLWEHAIPTACDVESMSMLVITDEKLPFVACIWCF